MILCNPPCCTPGYTWCHTPGHRQGHTWGCTPGHNHAAQTLYSSCKHAGIISPPHITGPPVNTPTRQDCSTPSHRRAPSATCLSLWASWQSRHTQPVQGLAVSPERVQQESKEGTVLGVRKNKQTKKPSIYYFTHTIYRPGMPAIMSSSQARPHSSSPLLLPLLMLNEHTNCQHQRDLSSSSGVPALDALPSGCRAGSITWPHSPEAATGASQGPAR